MLSRSNASSASSSLAFLACLNDMAYLFSTAIASPFDLNVRVEEDDDDNLPFDLNEAILEDHTTYGNVLSSFVLFYIFKATTCANVSHFLSSLLDEAEATLAA